MQMTVKGVKLRSESFLSISPGILELWRKTLGGGADSASPAWIVLSCFRMVEEKQDGGVFCPCRGKIELNNINFSGKIRIKRK